MSNRNQPVHEESAQVGADELSLEDLEQASGGKEDVSDELSIDELDVATGGTDAPPPPPDPDAGC